MPQLGERPQARGIEWHHLPIVDVRPADERFEPLWVDRDPRLVRTLRDGGKVLIQCRGGLGQAGTVWRRRRWPAWACPSERR